MANPKRTVGTSSAEWRAIQAFLEPVHCWMDESGTIWVLNSVVAKGGMDPRTFLELCQALQAEAKAKAQ